MGRPAPTVEESAAGGRAGLRLRRVQLWASLAVAAVLLAISAIGTDRGIRAFVEDADWAARAHQNLEHLSSIYALVKDAESSQRGLLLTGNEAFEDGFYEALPQVRAALGELRLQMAGSAAQQQRLNELAATIERRLETASDIAARFRRSGFEAAREEVAKGSGAELMREIEERVAEMAEAERQLLASRSADSTRTRLAVRLVGIGGIAISGLILMAVFTVLLGEVRARGRAERAATLAQLELAESVRQLTLRTAETRSLSEYAGLLQSCRSVGEAMELSRRTFTRLLPGDTATVYMLRASNDLLQSTAEWGEHAVPSSEAMAPADCWALRRGQPHGVDDAAAGHVCPHVRVTEAEPGARTLCVPMAAQGETLGMVYFSGPGAESDQRRVLAVALVEQLSLALSNLRLQETLRTQSIRDPLTGLFNRRYLEESLPRELARCGRRGQPLALLMLDVDHFKRFNDAHGHDGGDALLVELGRLLQASCRSEDIACRFGGEEFTLILPEVDPAAARQRAEEIRTRIEELRVVHLHAALSPVTASIGYSAFPHDGTAPADLLRSADAALYRAKAGGRNRVMRAS